MHRLKGKVLMLGAVATLAALVVLLLGSLGGASTVSATNPTPTPKAPNNNLGNLGGTYDFVVPGGTVATPDKSFGLYSCIAKINHDSGGALDLKIVCYADIPLGDANGEPTADLPGEGPDQVPGPPPPPPYTTLPVFQGNGSVTAGKANFIVCFRTGGLVGPNIIARVNVPGMKAQLAGGPPKNTPGVAAGTVDIFFSQSATACASKTPKGSPSTTLPLNLFRVATKSGADVGCAASPFVGRATRCLNYDGGAPSLDTCSDAAELSGAKPCGRDPFNPYDGSIANLTGTYSTLAVVAPASCPDNNPCPPPAMIPGISYHCISSLNDTAVGTPRNIPVRIYCYIDIPQGAGVAVNPQGYPGCAGDGFDGAAPPGIVKNRPGNPASCTGVVLWGDVDSKHSQLTGVLNNKTLTTTGCFEDVDGFSPLGNVYVSATQDAYTGAGSVNIYAAQTLANCNAATPVGAPTVATLYVARQSNNLMRDTDNDGCTDAEELFGNALGAEAFGGLRDPYNRWDLYDAALSDGTIDLFNDIFGVAFDFGTAGTPFTDRAAPITGGNVWNLPGPDGTVDLFNDIFGVAFQFGHTCDGTPGP